MPEVRTKKPPWWSTMQGAERHARFLAGAADAEYRDCSCRSAEREAESLAWKCNPFREPPLMPNPSFEARPNGKPPGPGRWYAVHFHRPGPGVMPSVPPQLER